jgi:N-methylhydantoinase B/oxoprolinase/acetone carboxylase alpha subunit
MLTDSAGAGKWRGGSGVRLEVEFLGRGEIITMETSRTREGSPGIRGGGYGSRQRQMRKKCDGSVETIGGLTDTGEWLPQMLGGVPFNPGESFVFESGGGGGWGDPFDRAAGLVVQDVVNGVISGEAAKSIYGVVVDDDGTLNEEETVQLRQVRGRRPEGA